MIVCLRTVKVPPNERERFLKWIEENKELREAHGILLELVLDRSDRQNPEKALRPFDVEPGEDGEMIVLTAWASHETFDAWIDTPDRDRLTASDVHGSVQYRPITRHDVVGGYISPSGLTEVADDLREGKP